MQNSGISDVSPPKAPSASGKKSITIEALAKTWLGNHRAWQRVQIALVDLAVAVDRMPADSLTPRAADALERLRGLL